MFIKLITNRNINDHIGDIKKLGINRLWIKISKLIFHLINLLYAAPFIILIYLIKKIVLVRIGLLETNALGHYTYATEVYLAENLYDVKKIPTIDIWHTQETICNTFIHKVRKKQFRILPRFFISPVYFYLIRFKLFEDNIVPFRNNEFYKIRNKLPNQFTDYKRMLHKYQTQLIFDKNEKNFCINELKKLGIDIKKKIATVHNRDHLYNNEKFECERNCSIENFKSAINFLIQNGYQVIRIGKVSKRNLNIDGLINYSGSNIRSDILDIFLCSITNLHIGCSSGLSTVPFIFKRNIVWTNIVHNEGTELSGRDFLYIPKKTFDNDKKDVLFKSKLSLGRFNSNSHLFNYQENTEDEILELVIEKVARINGNWKKPSDYDFLQEEYKRQYPLNIGKFTNGCVSYYYLTKHL